MKITRTPLSIRSEFYSKELGVERSAGCHMKSVLEYISHTAGFDKKYEDAPDPSVDDVLERYAACGFIWEHVMTREMVEVSRIRLSTDIMEPGELFWCYHCSKVYQGNQIGRDHCAAYKHKGIFATPDACRMVPWRTVEFKFTWKSSNRTGEDHIDKIWMWPNQTLGYSFLLGAEEAELYAMFALGDYSNRGRPEPAAYRFDMQFRPRESKRLWDMVVYNAIEGGFLEV